MIEFYNKKSTYCGFFCFGFNYLQDLAEPDFFPEADFEFEDLVEQAFVEQAFVDEVASFAASAFALLAVFFLPNIVTSLFQGITTL